MKSYKAVRSGNDERDKRNFIGIKISHQFSFNIKFEKKEKQREICILNGIMQNPLLFCMCS